MPIQRRRLITYRSLFAFVVFLCAFAFVLGQKCTSHAQNKKKRKTSRDNVTLKASATSTDSTNRQRITLKLNVASGWYIYANKVGNADLQANATEVAIAGKSKPASVKTIYPDGKKVNKYNTEFRIYQGDVVLTTDVVRAPGDSAPLRVKLRVSSCSEKGLCLPPSIIEFNVPAYRK